MSDIEGQSPSWADVILGAIDSRLLDVHTALPARVESYDSAKQTVDVIPMVQRVLLDESGERVREDLPRLPAVPVCFPRGGDYSITWPLKRGDKVLIVFSEYSIGAWQSNGDTDPQDDRRHGLSGAIAIPGVYPSGEATSQVASDAMVISASKTLIGSKDASHGIALGDEVLSYLQNLKSTFDTHMHIAGGTLLDGTSAPVTGTTGAPSSSAPSPGSAIQSSKHKIDG